MITKVESTLTPDQATRDIFTLLIDGNRKSQVSQVISHNMSDTQVASAVLVRAGGDLEAIGELLRSLPGSEVVCHTVAISVFRSKRQES